MKRLLLLLLPLLCALGLRAETIDLGEFGRLSFAVDASAWKVASANMNDGTFEVMISPRNGANAYAGFTISLRPGLAATSRERLQAALVADSREEATGARQTAETSLAALPASGELEEKLTAIHAEIEGKRARLAEARAATGHQHLRLDPRQRTAQLLVPGMRLDPGGIAKGYAADEALKTLRAHGITRALIDYDATRKSALSKAGYVTRDAREVERKKVGLHSARRRKQFSKR